MRKNIKYLVCLLAMIIVMAGMTGCGDRTETVKKETESKEDSNKDKDDDKDADKDKDDNKDTDKDKDDDKDVNKDKDDNKDTDKDKDEEVDGEIKSDVSDWEEYSGTGYSFKLSSSWEKTDNASAELAFVHTSTAADGFAENINTMTQDVSAFDVDLESYLDISLEQYETLGYEVVDYKHMTVDGVKGYYCITSAEVQSVKCYVSQYFTIIDDTAYIFTFASDSDGFNELEEEVKDIYRTIKFK